MTLQREEVTTGLDRELEAFEDLIRSLTDEQWAAPTRCDGWTVADVAAHVIGTMTEVVAGRVAGLGAPGVNQGIVDERAGRSPAELADELAAAREGARALMASFDDAAWEAPVPGDVAASVGEGVGILWYDAFVHADDIRSAAALPSSGGPGLRASVLYLVRELERAGWGPTTLVVDGVGTIAVGEGGPEKAVDALEFVLAATGRLDPAKLGLDDDVNIYADR